MSAPKDYLTLSKIWKVAIEDPLDMLGLLRINPLKRFAAVFIVSGVILYVTRPKTLFTEKGPRPWQGMSDDKLAVPLNWLGVALLLGAGSILFV